MQTPSFLFAPGAGAPSSSRWMQAWRERLACLGPVETLDYPYQLEGRARPDPLGVLVEAHRAALRRLRERRSGPPVLIGKSMGSRIGCHLALEEPVTALICLGYPLRGAGKNGKLRDAVLLSLGTPALFVQGTRDPLCPLDELRSVLPRMSAPHALHVVESGDHSLAATKTELKARGQTQDDVDRGILEAIRGFLSPLLQP